MLSEATLISLRGLIYFSLGVLLYTKIGYFFFKWRSSYITNRGFARSLVERKHVILTGANAGIGFEAAKKLAELGAVVHMICRDLARGHEAVAKLASELKLSNDQAKERLFLHKVDVSDLEAVRAFCVKEAPKFGVKFYALVHNAGVMNHKYELTAQKIESNSATNIVGPYLMTKMLMENGLVAAGSKVIMVTSGGLYTQQLKNSIDAIQGLGKGKFSGMRQYARNKRQQVALTEYWTSKYPQINFYSWHPGWADTAALQKSMPDFRNKMAKLLRSPTEAAQPLCELIISPSDELVSGKLYFDGRITFKHFPFLGTSYSKKQVDKLVESLDSLSHL